MDARTLDDLIDLGCATAETKGPCGILDEVMFLMPLGVAIDED